LIRRSRRNFNGAHNIFLNVRDAVARVNGEPTTADLCYRDASQLPGDFETA
jgi:hypothetical protein